jgi:hypothetical protein
MAKIIVYHSYYGCETGCCGHVMDIELDDGSVQEGRHFQFIHPYGEDARKFAEDMVREEFGEEHVADLDWENCLINED